MEDGATNVTDEDVSEIKPMDTEQDRL